MGPRAPNEYPYTPQQKRMAGYSKRPFLKRDTFIHTFTNHHFGETVTQNPVQVR